MDSKDMYTVIVSGVPFCLSGESILSDGPGTNVFVKRLLSDSGNLRAGTITFDRNASIFALIHDHLRGYDILPLDPADCGNMSEAKTLRYLRDDAVYYGLHQLENVVEAEIERIETLASQSADLKTRHSQEDLERIKETHALQFRRLKLDEAALDIAKDQCRIAAVAQKVAYVNKKADIHAAMSGHGMALADKGKVYSDVYKAIDAEWKAAAGAVESLSFLQKK